MIAPLTITRATAAYSLVSNSFAGGGAIPVTRLPRAPAPYLKISLDMAKVIIYSRVSTDKQTLEQQERTVNEWLQAHGLTPSHIISDEGVSGGVTYKARNLGRKVLPLLESGDILIVSEISRLGRSMADINKLVIDELKPRGVRLVIVQMGIDLDCAHIKAIDEMLLFAFSFAAQMEKELIQERTQSALEVRKQKLLNDGSFVSKAGNVCTKLGRPAGADTHKAAAISAARRRESAQQNPVNKVIWGVLHAASVNGAPPTSEALVKAVEQLNAMDVRTSSGLPFDVNRARSAYHNLKKTYSKIA